MGKGKGVSKESSAASPAVRPKRRTKAPKGALREKLKAGAVTSAPLSSHKTPSSPLPPSSPFASSSQMLQDFLPVASSENGIDRPDIEKPFYEEDNVLEEERDFDSEVYRMQEVADAHAESNDVSTNSDPFGFFRVETKLKAERLEYPTKTQKSLPPPAVIQPLKRPQSPHKQRIGKRSAARSLAPSLPSSPSPAKHRATKPAWQEQEALDIGDSADHERTEEDDPARADQPPEPAKVKGGARGRKKLRSNDTSIDPEVLAKDLKALLPKRATRRTTKARGNSDSDSSVQPQRKAKARRGVKRGKEEDENEDADEAWTTERQKRAEYFRKLEGYKVEKENVYVI